MKKKKSPYEDFPNNFYILGVKGEPDVIKVGITCNISHRLYTLKDYNKREYFIMGLFEVGKRSHTEDFEKIILNKYGKYIVNLDWIVSGKREHLPIHLVDDIKRDCEKLHDVLSIKMINLYCNHRNVTSSFVKDYLWVIKSTKQYCGNLRIRTPNLTKKEFAFLKILLLELKRCNTLGLKYLRIPYAFVRKHFSTKIPFIELGTEGIYSVEDLISFLKMNIDAIPFIKGKGYISISEISKDRFKCNYAQILYTQESSM